MSNCQAPTPYIFSKWNNSIEIELSENKRVKNIFLLGSKEKIEWKYMTGNKLKIEIPKMTIREIPCRTAWTFKIVLK